MVHFGHNFSQKHGTRLISFETKIVGTCINFSRIIFGIIITFYVFQIQILLTSKMAANLILTRVQQSLLSAAGLPTDIKFLFKEEKETGSIEEIHAHKFILALVSDVFQAGFYGGMADEGSIEIKDASKMAFEVMIKFIYIKITDLSSYDFDVLCETYYLADKYNINVLKNETLRSIRNKDISGGNFLEVTKLAEQYAAHVELVDTLYKAVSQKLSIEFGVKLSREGAEFFKNIDSDATPISSKSLLRLLVDLETVPPALCGNCRAFPCRSGSGITKEHFMPGAKVSAVDGKGNPDVVKLGHMTSISNETFSGIMKDGTSDEEYTLSPDYYVYYCKDV